MKKADKALYHIKQNGKAGYYMYANAEETVNQKKSVDLKKIVKGLKSDERNHGTLNLGHRDFNTVYEFVYNLVDRFGYDMQFMMLTLEPADYDEFDIDEQEYAIKCMENVINDSLRNIDVCTRFSSEQFLIVLLNAQQSDVEMISNRIMERFYKVYHRKAVRLSYDVADLSETDVE